MNSNFISDGGNSLLTLTFIEQIKQSYSLIDINYLFDIILHKNFQDLIEYINNPFQQQQQQQKSIEYISSNFSINSIININFEYIWSIERCSKIIYHNKNHIISQYSSFPNELTNNSIKEKSLILNWKSSMNKCIDASPLIILFDQYRQYIIIGSHSGLINAYEITNGLIIWSFQANNRIESSGIISRNGEFFIIGDYSGILYLINCLNGKLYSTYQCNDLIKTIPCINLLFDIIYIGSHDQFIHAIQIQEISSKCIWKFELNSSCYSSPQLSKDNNQLFVASLNGNIFALESNNGKLLWKQLLNKPIFSTIGIWNDKYLIIGCVDQKLYCLNCDNGEKVKIYIKF